jgi:hypothetical protein
VTGLRAWFDKLTGRCPPVEEPPASSGPVAPAPRVRTLEQVLHDKTPRKTSPTGTATSPARSLSMPPVSPVVLGG